MKDRKMPENDPIAARWKLVAEKTYLDFPYLQIVERGIRKVSDPDDQEPHRFYVLQANDWCNIIPITEDGKIVLAHQFRAGILAGSYEFPGGVVESTDADLTATALREMTEETGYQPLPHARCKVLGSSFPNPALQDNCVHSLVVGPVKKTGLQNLDPMEDIEVVEIDIEELPRLYREGKFTHALMLTSLFHLLMQDTTSEKGLIETLKAFSKSP
jgi:ADP-ribose pyrophosphatase